MNYLITMVFVEQPLALHRSAKKLVHYLLPFYSLYLKDASVAPFARHPCVQILRSCAKCWYWMKNWRKMFRAKLHARLVKSEKGIPISLLFSEKCADILISMLAWNWIIGWMDPGGQFFSQLGHESVGRVGGLKHIPWDQNCGLASYFYSFRHW